MFQMELEAKLDIEDLVLPSKQFGILNMETIDIKEEPLEQISNNMLIDESKKSGEFPMVHERINSSSFATVPLKNEVFQPEIVPTLTPQVHCVRGQSGFFDLVLTERNMQIKFDLRLSVYSLGEDI